MYFKILFVVVALIACNSVNAEVVQAGAVGCPSKILLNRQNRMLEKGDHRVTYGCWNVGKPTHVIVERGTPRRSLVRVKGSPTRYFVNTRRVDSDYE